MWRQHTHRLTGSERLERWACKGLSSSFSVLGGKDIITDPGQMEWLHTQYSHVWVLGPLGPAFSCKLKYLAFVCDGKTEALVTWRADTCQVEESVHNRLALKWEQTPHLQLNCRSCPGAGKCAPGHDYGDELGTAIALCWCWHVILSQVKLSPAQRSSFILPVVFYLKCVPGLFFRGSFFADQKRINVVVVGGHGLSFELPLFWFCPVVVTNTVTETLQRRKGFVRLHCWITIRHWEESGQELQAGIRKQEPWRDAVFWHSLASSQAHTQLAFLYKVQKHLLGMALPTLDSTLL